MFSLAGLGAAALLIFRAADDVVFLFLELAGNINAGNGAIVFPAA